MKLFFTLFALLFISFNGFGQTAKIDSLKSVLDLNTHDTIKLNTYSEIINFYTTNDFDLAERYCEEMKSYLLNKNLPKYEILYFLLRGKIEYRKTNIEEALEYFKQGLNHKAIENFKIQKATLLNNTASSYAVMGNDDLALAFVNRAISLNKNIDNAEGLMHSYDVLISYYSIKEDIVNESLYLSKLFELATKENDKNYLAQTHLRLAVVASKEYDFDDAISHFEKAKELHKKINPDNMLYLSLIEYQIANILCIKEDYNQAIPRLLKIKADYEEKYDNPILFLLIDKELLSSYTSIDDFQNAKIYYNRLKDKTFPGDDFNQSTLKLILSEYEIKYDEINDKTLIRLFEVKNEGERSGHKELLSNASYKLSDYYWKTSQYKKSRIELMNYVELKDSINTQENKIINLSLKRKFKNQETEAENYRLKSEKAEQQLQLTKENRNKWFLSGGLIGSLAILGVVGFSYQRNRKQKKQIENLQKELHHRVKNNLSIIDTFIEVVKKELPDAKAQGKLNELQNRIISINEVHRQFYQNRNITRLNLREYIGTLVENVSHSFGKPEIELKTEIPETVVLGAERSFPVGLIVNEFLTNSYKYAFENNGTGKIWVSLKEKGNNYLLSLSDNGKGLPAGFDVKETNSFGLRIIKLLTEQLNGNFSMKGDDGVSLEIEFPKT